MDVPAFIAEQIKLIETEKTADLLQTSVNFSELLKKGFALTSLVNTGIRTGLGGKCLVELEPSTNRDQLPSHKFRVGDVISICDTKKTDSNPSSSGVIYRITEKSITIAFKDDIPEDLSSVCSIFKIANNITFERMINEMKFISKINLDTADSLIRVLFNRSPLTYDTGGEDIEFFDSTLNESQKAAILHSLSANEVSLIHGPPGTGKTHTCVEIILQLVKRGKRVLVCGPSNISVDNLVERLSKKKIDIVRIGNPARILPEVLDHALEVRIRSSEEGVIVNDVRDELDKALKALSKTRGKGKRDAYGNIKELRSELRQRERKVVSDILGSAQVMLSSLSGAASKTLYNTYKEKGSFDVVLIDEATQAYEVECWMAITKAKKLILAGDPCQLPPTVISGSGNNGLEKTLFDRVLEMYGNDVKRMLEVQYRANHLIMDFSSKEFYSSKLVSHSSVINQTLSSSSNNYEYAESPLLFIDTSVSDLHEQLETNKNNTISDSKFNQGEADIVVARIKHLVDDCEIGQERICVISPYNAQVKLISSMLSSSFPLIEVNSIDGFQGREKDIVILSLVRSNNDGKVGFLSDERRLNVGITRAKKQLIVVANSQTLSRGSKFLKRFIEYLEEFAEIQFPE